MTPAAAKLIGAGLATIALAGVGIGIGNIFGSFVAALGILGIAPLAMDVGFILLEFLVAALQAYIFTILSCLYLNDAIHLHH